MPGLFSRIKTWVSLEDVTYSTLNAEFDNIITNFVPLMMDDYSTNVVQMQVQTSPGDVGSESLATTFAGELARVRHVLAAMKGTDFWYESVNNSITSLADALGDAIAPNRIVSGRMRTESSQPIYLVPNGAGLTCSVKGTTTNLKVYINDTLATVSTNLASGTLGAAPSSNNTCLVNDASADGSEYTKYFGEYGSSIIVDAAGTEITALVGKFAAFKVGAEYFIARVKSATELTEVRRGWFFDSADAPLPRVVISDNDTITLLKLGWIFLTSAGALTATYNEPTYAASAPGTPSAGDYWYDIDAQTWMRYDGGAWVSADAILIGTVASTSSACVAGRSADFSLQFDDLNTITLEKFDNTQVRAKLPRNKISVYGTEVNFGSYLPRWDMDSDLDSGLVEAASTIYFLYVTEGGDPKISTLAPIDRTGDLGGLYHPFQAWRCVGQAHNDASSNFEAVLSCNDISENNYAITHSIAASALTIKLHAPPNLRFAIRSATLATGENVPMSVLPGTSLTVTSGATLGMTNTVQTNLYAFAVLANGRSSLGISNGKIRPSELITTVAMTAASDSSTTLYTKSAHTSASIRALARMTATEATVGTWATDVSLVYLDKIPFTNEVRSQTFTGSGTFNVPTTTYKIKALVVGAGAQGGGGGGTIGSNGSGGNGGKGGKAGTVIFGEYPVVPGDPITVTIGAGGSGAGSGGSSNTNGTNGGNGGTSSLSGTGISVSAAGGIGGSGGLSQTILIVTVPGEAGDAGENGIGAGGTAGSGASPGNNGGTGGNASANTGSGGGGGGGAKSTGSIQTGGSGGTGGSGQVIIYWEE
jgi:hypothetical protein